MAYIEVWCSPNGEGTFMERCLPGPLASMQRSGTRLPVPNSTRWKLRSSPGEHTDHGGAGVFAVDWEKITDRAAVAQIQNLEFQRAGKRLWPGEWQS